jgi:hypothetical protein
LETLNSKNFLFGAGSLKVIALIAMTADHVGVRFDYALPLGVLYVLFAIGGVTFPTLAYLLTEGYLHTRNFKNYALRLFIFALISIIPYAIVFGPQLNVLFTLLLGLLIIRLYDTMKNKGLFIALFIGAVLFTYFCDWNSIGVPIIFIGYIYRKYPVKRIVFPVLVTYVYGAVNLIAGLVDGQGAYVLPQVFFFFIGCTLTIPLLLHYNGKRSRKLPKYFFYLYYPAHLTVIFFIYYRLFGLPETAEFLRGIVG